MKQHTADSILEALKTPRRTEPVEAMGGTAHVAAMTAEERDAWELATAAKSTGPRNVRGALLAATLCDAEGNQLFSDPDAASKLAKLPARDIEPLIAVAFELNGLGAKDMDELAGKSPSGDAAA